MKRSHLYSAILLIHGLFFLTPPTMAANRFWVASVTSNWNNTTNWSASSGGVAGASVPTALDAVIFDNLGLGSCSIDAAVNIISITINSGYSGTITQGANTIAVSSIATFGDGIFTGGTANITVTGAFTLSGTSFTSTSAILELRDNAAFTSGFFIHNNGSVRFNSTNTAAQTISGTSPSLYILEFVGIGRDYTISSAGTITVLNSLNLSGSLFYNLNTGTIDVKGDINVSNSATGCGGNALININGTGTQNFNGNTTSGQGALPQLTINKSLGTLNLTNFPTVSNNFTFTAGAINAGTSTFCFTHGNVGSYAISGSMTLNNIEFNVNSSGLTATISAATTLIANGNLNLSGAGNTIINTGNINVNGNIVLTNTASGNGGSATINIVGTSGESIDGTAVVSGQSRLPIININKSSGTLSLLGNISFSANVTYTAGIINAGTSNVFLVNNLTITGSFNVFNLSVNTIGTVTITIASGSTITVANDYTMQTGALNNININTGTIAVQGNIIDNNTGTGGGGTGTLLINGTGAQSISSTGVIYQGTLPAVTINKISGTLTMPSLITERSNWTYITGILDLTTNNSTVVFGNTLTITGSQTFNNIIFDGGGTYTFTIAGATTLTANGNISISGASNVTLNTGTINLLGNLNLTNTATNGGGNATINFIGTGNQAITGTLTMYQSSLPAITINKALGTLTFPALITVRGNWTYIAGTYDVATNNSNIVFGNSLTITGTHTLNNITFDGAGTFTFVTAAATTLTVSGNMTMSGSANIILNSGNINLNGNLILTNTATAGTGSTAITFVSSVNQNIISALLINQCNLPAVIINKPAGILTFPSIITVRGNWTYTSGTLDVTTNNSTVVFNNNISITGSHALNNVNLEGNFNNTYAISAGTVLTVTGTLTTSGSSNVNLTTAVIAATGIQAQGDIIINNTSLGSGGNGTILINGTGPQSFTSTSATGQGRMPYIKIQKTSGTLTLGGIISQSRDWTYVSGTVNPATSTVVFGGNNIAISSAGMNFNHVSVSSNTTTLSNSLSVNGNIAISGTGILAPGANTINLSGNWGNYGTAGLTEATSTINFNGTTLQTITSPGGENFTNLIVNNTGTGIQLINAATAAATLTMTQGNIDLNNNTLTLGLSAINNGTLARTNGSMINMGSFTRWFKITTTIPDGSINGLFPVGTSSDYIPFNVSAPLTGPTTGGTISASYTNSTTNTVLSPSVADGIFSLVVRKDLNWAISTGNGLAGGTYNLMAQGTAFGAVGSVSDLRLMLINNVVGTAGINAGTILNPQVNRTGLTSANLPNSFYIGSVNVISTTLPVTLISFTATIENDIIRLDWETAAEINSDHFTIQRSADVSGWEDLKVIRGLLDNRVNNYYTVNDENPLNGKSYYRLRQTDIDGSETFSSVRTIDMNRQTIINIYPNPATNYITIVFSGKGKSNFAILDINGQRIYPPVSMNGNNARLNLTGVSAGTYFIQISQGNSTEIRKIIIRSH